MILLFFMAINYEEIEIQAKQILDRFIDALKSVDKEIKNESYIDREEFERIEKNGEEYDSEFKNKILENAPEHDEDFILVERGSWK